MKREKIIDILNPKSIGYEVIAKGWVRTKRGNRQINFIALNDGSTIQNLQIVVDVNSFSEELLKKITTGASLSVLGVVNKSEGAEQNVELQASKIELLGVCDVNEYPLQPKRHSLEFLREMAHLRFRTNIFGAITRIRHAMIFAVHQFFTSKGFVNIHTPIITASDAEGAGEMFRVTSFDLNELPKNESGDIDYAKDFFGKPTNLTVSGQLEGELAAMGLSEIYTFGPTFRAENSNTTRHLAEFWMIEPEMAFYDLEDNMDLAESFLKYLIQYALDHCQDDLQFLSQRLQSEENNLKAEDRSMELISKLKFVIQNSFERLTYSKAISILKDSKPNKKGKFNYPITGFGSDLQSEHERYLVEKHFKKPVILIDYPKEIKAFYMKQNSDSKTVRAMDVLFPQIGEIVGGSQREEDYEKLLSRMNELNIPTKEMSWYLDTRRFGTVPHSGFGLGFERFLLFVTGMTNIRDVIPFPRTPQSANF